MAEKAQHGEVEAASIHFTVFLQIIAIVNYL